ncbi:MAG: hypothetical protein AAFU73_21375 [Planctomycetota bacterium]
MSATLLSLELARPLHGAVPLVLAAVLLLASLRSARAGGPARPLGTARFLPETSGDGARGPRLDLPPSRLLAIGALLLSAVALAGPTPREPAPDARVLRVLVDRSPSMYLPIDPAAPAGERRIEAAARAVVEAARGPWSAALGGPLELEWEPLDRGRPASRAPALPSELRVPPRPAVPEPRFVGVDAADVVWLTDKARARPARAGLAAGGGPAVPGPVAWSPRGALVWDGRDTVREADAARAPLLAVADGLDDGLAALVEAWRVDRGVELAARNDVEVELSVQGPDPSGSAAFEVVVRGTGWSARALAPRAGVDAAWAVRPGRVELGILALAGDPDDPSAFAVDLLGALDRAVLPPPGVVPLSERRSAGEAALAAPTEGAGDRTSAGAAGRARTARRIEAMAALLAALLALGAAAARSVGR